MSDLAEYRLAIAFNENIAGVFTVDGSTLDGTDGLTDVGVFAGTFDDVTDDMQAPIEVVYGTDNLMSAIQAGNMTVTVARVDDPDYWNPNNSASPLNSVTPGFEAMRPIKLKAIVDDIEHSLFRGFIRHCTWNSKTLTCELYCEDLLLWASRVYPVIASTGKTTVGAVVKMLFALVDPTIVAICDRGIDLDDFSADGSLSVTEILADILEVDLGTVYINPDGVPVYVQHDTPLAADPAATVIVTQQTSQVQSGIDLDDIGTRVQVTKIDPISGDEAGTWTAIDSDAEHRLGRADLPAVNSSYVGDGDALADELVFQGVRGKPPVTLRFGNVDGATLLLMLTSPPLTVFNVEDSFGGNQGDVIAQRLTHTIQQGGLHELECLAAARLARAMTVDGSALDGPDGLRYP